MPTHGSVAARARDGKDKVPAYYCPEPKCLWRTYDARTDTFTPCGNHGRLHPDAIKREDGINA